MAVTAKQLQNLEKRKRYGIEVPPAKSPGRPKTVDFVAAFRDYMSDPARTKALFETMRKKKADISMYYLGGKPLEQVRIDQTVVATSVPVEKLEEAAKLARNL